MADPVPVPAVPPEQLRALASDLKRLGHRLAYIRRRDDSPALARAATGITAARQAVRAELEARDAEQP